MLGSAVLLMSLGVPCVALGLYMRRHPPQRRKVSGSKATKKTKKTGREDDDADDLPTGDRSLIVGGVVLTLAGAGLLVAHLLR